MDSAEEVARKALELLPQILKERPDLAFKLYEELRKHFVPRDAFEKFLERFDAALREMKEIREEYNRRFEELRREMNQRFEELRREFNERFEEIRREYNERFAKIDERFASIEESIAEMRREYNERFAKIDERFARIEESIAEMRREYNERFVKIDERFARVDERFASIEERLADLTRRVNELAVEVRNIRIELGAVGRRLGRGLQRLILETYEDALRRFGVEIKEIRGLKVTDPDGKVVPKGGVLEVDVFITDERKVFIEVKAYVERDDAEWFWAKTRRIEELLGIKADRVIVAAEATDLAREFCKQNKIAPIAHKIVKEEE